MSSDDTFELQPELLDDFFAECDEQLSTARTQISALETKTGDEAGALHAIYRAVHSFKGNAAIVGLAAGEQLAHAVEDLARRLTRGETPLGAEQIDVLARAFHRLEQIVATFRLRQTAPNIADLLSELAPYRGSKPTAEEPRTTAPTKTAPAAAAPPAPTASRWKATFVPSPALDERGINLASVRERLNAAGRIERAVPVIGAGGGGMNFEFEVALDGEPADPAGWAADGITWHPPAPEPAPHRSEESGEMAAAAMFTAPSHIVRVDLSRLDELMRITGEMVIQRSRLQDQIRQLGGERLGLQEVVHAFSRSLREMREAIVRVRLVPIAEIFGRMPFVIRDLNRDTGKKVRLVLEGQDTPIDKYLVERLKEPLLHLVRNAFTHGIESPEAREQAGKPAEATLRLSASTAGDKVQIEIHDDGGGIDAAHVAARATAAGLEVPDQPDADALLRILCLPGFSTRDEADRAAGRGVGMAVVDHTVAELGGTLSLATEPGRYTRFTLRLPLTLSITDTFIVAAGTQTCAVPQGDVRELIQIGREDVRTINQTEVAPFRGDLLPLVQLRQIFRAAPATATQWPVLVIEGERGRFGLVVDRVQGQREVVVRGMNDPLVRVPGVSGATELGDGRPVLVLDVGGIKEACARAREPGRATPLLAP